MRTPLIAGNWKMNMDLQSARVLVSGIVSELPVIDGKVEVAVCPSFVYLFPMAKAVADSPIQIGAQDLFFEASGAFTGEVSAGMVADTGASLVILGHSERRHTIGHHEDDWMIHRKVSAALGAGLTPILCVGETLEQREAGQTLEVVTFQLVAALHGIKLGKASDLVVAYEPVWAIGTGKTATPQQAQDVHAHIRAELRGLYGDLADEIRILYGGSMKPDNAAELIGQADVDGGLIGGASLKPASFVGIIAAALAS